MKEVRKCIAQARKVLVTSSSSRAFCLLSARCVALISNHCRHEKKAPLSASSQFLCVDWRHFSRSGSGWIHETPRSTAAILSLCLLFFTLLARYRFTPTAPKLKVIANTIIISTREKPNLDTRFLKVTLITWHHLCAKMFTLEI